MMTTQLGGPMTISVDVPGVQGALAVAYLKVLGMCCPECGEHVSGALQRLDGVSLAEVQLNAHLVGVLYDPGRVTPPELVEAVAAAGRDAQHRYQGVFLAKCRLS